jgi:cold shock protein
MQTGTVVSWSDPKGFGFIKTAERDYFVHFTSVVSAEHYKSLRIGDKVQFEVEAGPSGRDQAVRVTVFQKAVA